MVEDSLRENATTFDLIRTTNIAVGCAYVQGTQRKEPHTSFSFDRNPNPHLPVEKMLSSAPQVSWALVSSTVLTLVVHVASSPF